MVGETSAATKCAYSDDRGQCKAWSQQGKQYCWYHDPALAEERALASSKGGKRRHLVPGIPDAQPPQSPQDVAAIMSIVLAGVLRGEIDPRIANSSAYVVGQLIKAIEVSQLERRLQALEQKMAGKQ